MELIVNLQAQAPSASVLKLTHLSVHLVAGWAPHLLHLKTLSEAPGRSIPLAISPRLEVCRYSYYWPVLNPRSACFPSSEPEELLTSVPGAQASLFVTWTDVKHLPGHLRHPCTSRQDDWHWFAGSPADFAFPAAHNQHWALLLHI